MGRKTGGEEEQEQSGDEGEKEEPRGKKLQRGEESGESSRGDLGGGAAENGEEDLR